MMLKCAYCGREFLKEENRGGRKYCSPECRREADKANKRNRYVGKREKVCRFCGTKLPKFKTKFCSNDCKDKWNRIKNGKVQSYESVEKICVCCGKSFYTYKQNRCTCSSECAKFIRKDHRCKSIVIDRDITLSKLAERDGQVCQLCGKPVDWSDYEKKGTNIICGNNYPSIDHIIPISHGGVHAWTNVQLSHRSCNSAKGNKMIG